MTQQPGQDPHGRPWDGPSYGASQGHPPPPAAWGPPGSWGPPVQEPGPDDRTWGSAAHWSALVGAFVALAFLGPLVVLLVRSGAPWVRRQAVESLNFQLSMLVYGIVGSIAAVLVVIVTLGLGALVVVPLAFAAGVFWLVQTILGAVRAGNGREHRYPLTIRMVS